MTSSALLIPGHRPHRVSGSGVQVIAHRGASSCAPENTISAVRAAVAIGADAVEIDVRRSRDGEFVVVHDSTVGRTTDVHRRRWRRCGPRVDELTLSQLRCLDAGSWRGPSFAGERIPTLGEVLALVTSTQSRLLIDVKRPLGEPRHLRDLTALLRAEPALRRRITLQSSDVRVVQGLREKLPELTMALLTRGGPGNLGECSRWADQVSVHHRGVDRRTVEAVKGWGMHCVAWTVNSPVSMSRLLRLGIDGVITDHPDRLLTLMNGQRFQDD